MERSFLVGNWAGKEVVMRSTDGAVSDADRLFAEKLSERASEVTLTVSDMGMFELIFDRPLKGECAFIENTFWLFEEGVAKQLEMGQGDYKQLGMPIEVDGQDIILDLKMFKMKFGKK